MNASSSNELNNHSASDKLVNEILGLNLTPSPIVLQRAWNLASENNANIDKIATTITHDPVLLFEFLQAANKDNQKTQKPIAYSPQHAITQLSPTNIRELLQSLSNRPSLEETPETATVLETLRGIGVSMSIIASIVASAVKISLISNARTAGLFGTMGHMLCCTHLRSTYVKAFNTYGIKRIDRRLHSEQSLSIAELQHTYLTQGSLPIDYLYALDKYFEIPSSNNEVAYSSIDLFTLRNIVQSAIEFVIAYDTGRWDRFHPERVIPTGAAIRMLRLEDDNYAQVFTRCENYLYKVHDANKHLKNNFNPFTAENYIYGSLYVAQSENETEQEKLASDTFMPPISTGSVSISDDTPLDQEEEQKQIAEVFLSMGIKTLSRLVVNDVATLFQNNPETDTFYNTFLEIMINTSVFSRALIFVPSTKQPSIQIRYTQGDSAKPSDIIAVSNPFSCFILGMRRVRSFATSTADTDSPFGVSSFALAAIDTDNDLPVMLYADRNNDVIALEHRRIFTYLVNILRLRNFESPQ